MSNLKVAVRKRSGRRCEWVVMFNGYEVAGFGEWAYALAYANSIASGVGRA